MNLRTRGIVLSALPLAITLLLAIPAASVQLTASRAVARAAYSDGLSGAARDVEDAALDVGFEARRSVRDRKRGNVLYLQLLYPLKASATRLEGLADSDSTTRIAASIVTANVFAYLQVTDAAVSDAQNGHPERSIAALGSTRFSDLARGLRESVRSFDGRAHVDEVESLGALDRLWKSSLVLLVVAVLAAAGTCVLLLHYSGRAVRGILQLGRKADRYRRGEALGIPSHRIDEIGRLDVALHELLAAQELRERELQRYRLLAEVTHDIILFIDRLDLTIVDANASALATYGYERADLIGKPTAMLHGVDDPMDAATMAQSDTPAGLSYEGMHQRADGSVFPVEVHARTAEVEGRLTIVKTIRDISERRRAAEQVSLALDKAVEASRLKSEFVATMSHEIRTPMHGVIGMSELLLETQLSVQQREFAETVKESSLALLAIIDDILDFSKLEANKVQLEAVAFDPVALVASAVNLARGAAREKGIVLQSQASPHVPRVVSGDPTRLRQVLINLIGNAVKFTPAGAVTVALTVEREEVRSLVLAFAVTDTGIGVAADARERLFDAFVQGDGTTTRRFGGTGLGLSISSRLVELMGGRIWLGDHEGPGATFCFTTRVERTSEPPVSIAPAGDSLHVLVLDDDEATQRTFVATLRSWGMDAASAGDVERAETLLREAAGKDAPFDVVLIDYVLPRSDGLAFAASIGACPEFGAPAYILISAFDAVGRKEAALAAGCSAYLRKPVHPSDLFDTLHAIRRSRAEHLRPGSGHGKRARILLAEDNALIRRVAGFQLEDLDYDVDVVENGQEAVAAVATGEYELVLMDLRMPEMDGLAATRAIRAAERESGAHVVVVALTANVLDADREACTEAGMDDFLAKPLKLDALRGVLQRWLPERARHGR